MHEDIVTRLRWFTCEELNCESDVIAEEAANEIERLRTQRRQAWATISELEAELSIWYEIAKPRTEGKADNA